MIGFEKTFCNKIENFQNMNSVFKPGLSGGF